MLVYLAIACLVLGVSTVPACLDKVDPRTGVSNCSKMAAFCTNPVYQSLMWEQCPSTCGKCPGALSTCKKCQRRHAFQ